MNSKRISIIVPVYNPGRYLTKCVDSIIGQTYTNLEIILVNDGSTDGSKEKCQAYVLKDRRVKLINQPNQGVVVAKKNGVKSAAGDWIAFVDSDDYIEEDYIECLVRLQEESKADIVAVGHYHDIGGHSTLVKNGLKNGVYAVSEIMDKVLCTGEFFVYGITPQLYTKLFRAEILREAQMKVPDCIVAGDDAAVLYPCFVLADRLCVSDRAGYHYLQHPASITKTICREETKRLYTLLNYLQCFFKQKNLSFLFEKQLKLYEHYLFALRQIDIFDREEDKILMPYGGFNSGEQVVVYGAGVLGQRIVRYLTSDGRVRVVLWVDINNEFYRKNELQVDAPEKIIALKKEYDAILIANITETIAIQIKQYLLSIGAAEEKIRWFTERFRGKEG